MSGASVCVGAGRTRPQLHPAQAGRKKNPLPDLLEPGAGLSDVSTKWEKKDPVNGRYMWDFSVIKDILMNPVYTGAIASQKKEYRFKIGTIGEKKPEEWIVVENQHEPLVDRKTFDIVQRRAEIPAAPPPDRGNQACLRGLSSAASVGSR